MSSVPPAHIFISHASADDAFVASLRAQLEAHHLPVWVDSRQLRGGEQLDAAITEAIVDARQVIVVLSPQTINSPWVRKEIALAQATAKLREAHDYRVIPLLLPGVEPSALALWFAEEPVGVRVQLTTGGLSEALPALLAALGEHASADRKPLGAPAAAPVAELLLKLSDAKLEIVDGQTRVTATAQLYYEPAIVGERTVESKRFTFTAPLGPIESNDLRWYLEEYFGWPSGVFQQRAARIEAALPRWGQALYVAALSAPSAQELLRTWQALDATDRRFSMWVDADPPEGAPTETAANLREAANRLLALPWELLHDGRSYLFQGRQGVRIRRRLPNRYAQPAVLRRLPIRLLVVSPRPEAGVPYIDHRISARPLVEAMESLGELLELTLLTPPTLDALAVALQKAAEAGKPFDVIHFDGHGVYDEQHGLGALCFEDPNDATKLSGRRLTLVHADQLAALVRAHRIPLVFLEACQSAAEANPSASVAARLLEEGVTSIVAMSHSVLVETARRFVAAFYAELAQGVRVGRAMLAGQQALFHDTWRGRIMGAGELRLQDWFVPVLYQEEQDPQLLAALLPVDVQQLQARQRQLRLGDLPAAPTHHFQGRSRELLTLERLLAQAPYAVVVGQGGMGKTTLAVELARWLARTARFQRVAFVCLEDHHDVRSVIDSLGRQLLPEGAGWSVAQFKDLNVALQPIERALRDQATLIVLDNMESVLPLPHPSPPLVREGTVTGQTAMEGFCPKR